MAGREVEVPAKIDSVFSRCPMGTILMYTLNPDKIAGLNWKPTEYEKEYLTENYLKLPLLAGWFATNEGNVEEIIKAAPDILFSSARNPKGNIGSIEQADRLQKLLNIPVVMLDSGITKLPAIYRFAGSLLGEEDRAEALAHYTEALLAEVGEKAAAIPEADRVRVYYAEGIEGLQTDPGGSLHSELIEFIGAINVADVEDIIGVGGMGRAQVSPEQLANWQPEVIIACHDQGFASNSGTYNVILKDPRFSALNAVKESEVYEIPYKPFNIFDRPPSVNRIIGVKWLANLLYPDFFDDDIQQEFKNFYKLFYQIELTDEQVASILENAVP
jgi:iron complex transport system substrate-binding protein